LARLGPALLSLVLLGSACTALTLSVQEQTNAGSNIESGRRLIQEHACGSCHEIPGIVGARGRVGPPLARMGQRSFVAGMLRNTPDNMIFWLLHTQDVVPGNAMPATGLTEQEAADVAAYLGSLK